MGRAVVACIVEARFMYQVMLDTIVLGLESHKLVDSIEVLTVPQPEADAGRWLPADMGTTDVFVWVGANAPPLHRLTARGVFTVLYNADELDRPTKVDNHITYRQCEHLARAHVRQVWDYSFGNVLHCVSWRQRQPGLEDPEGLLAGLAAVANQSSRPHADLEYWSFNHGHHEHYYVPPGSVTLSASSAKLPLVDVANSSPRLIFIGSASRYYGQRVACLRHIRSRLTTELGGAETSASNKWCYDRWCPSAVPMCANLTCPLTVVHGVTTDEGWNQVRPHRPGIQ